MVPSAFDVVDHDLWSFFMQIAVLGAIFFAHFGTPCNTFSAARKEDGGPPPLRSKEEPWGLPNLSDDNMALVFLGNLFLLRTIEAAKVIFAMGGNFSIENPLYSLLWQVPTFCCLEREARLFLVDFDQCNFGAPSKKPTRLAVTHESFADLAGSCRGGHSHIVLKGKVWCDRRQRWVFRTKLAQEYPWKLCRLMAHYIDSLFQGGTPQFSASFQLISKDARKRPVGQVVPWKDHRQRMTALKAVASGYQLKRGALKPLLDVETEPGTAIEWALSIPHPLAAEVRLDPLLETAINMVATAPKEVIRLRSSRLQLWEQRALALLPETDRRLRAQSDPLLRRLLRGVPDDQPIALGQVCHVALYEALLSEVHSCDTDLASLLCKGFPIVGPIARSGRWPPYEKDQKQVPIEAALSRAWELRKKIIQRVGSVPCSVNLQKIWDATLEDVNEGSTVGPFYTQEEVTRALGVDDWIPTQRFEVVQKNKVRGCDSATTNMINQITLITEKLQLPSTDGNVAALRVLRSKCPGSQLAGWVLDERKAYRQVAIAPEHRKFSVICMKDPEKDRVAFFVMIGHSFGLVSAVYNYNRRSAAINEILVSLFNLVAFSFYDDKYGFETVETAPSAHWVAQSLHWWLGAHFDSKKLQLSLQPTILGVTCNLESMVLEIKEDRRKDLLEEIDQVIECGILEPGAAGKLKGKLMFGASQLWGKVGRAFLRVISERQYARFPLNDQFVLDRPLKEALIQWRKLIHHGPPRSIDFKVDKLADAVLFTDGFTPDARSGGSELDRIGAVLFDRRCSRALQFTSVVPSEVKAKWLDRKTQIVPIEMVAPILSLFTFADRLFNADVLIFIDSEAVEGSLIKGYSSKEDLCALVSVFWDQVLNLTCRVFIDRVATDANPADWPSRNDLSRGESAGWVTVDAVWPKALCFNSWSDDLLSQSKSSGLGSCSSAFFYSHCSVLIFELSLFV